MDEVVSQLLSYKTVILMVAVTIGTFFTRRVVETAAPTLKQVASEMDRAPMYPNQWAVWWNGVIIYLIPVILGAVLALSVKDLVVLDFASKSGLAMYGSTCGWFSATGYKILRKVLQARVGVELPGGTDPPPPPLAKEMGSEAESEK